MGALRKPARNHDRLVDRNRRAALLEAPPQSSNKGPNRLSLWAALLRHSVMFQYRPTQGSLHLPPTRSQKTRATQFKDIDTAGHPRQKNGVHRAATTGGVAFPSESKPDVHLFFSPSNTAGAVSTSTTFPQPHTATDIPLARSAASVRAKTVVLNAEIRMVWLARLFCEIAALFGFRAVFGGVVVCFFFFPSR